MLLHYVLTSNIDSKKELLGWFYPKLLAKQRIVFSNKDSVLLRMTSKNPNLLKMIETFDLMEV